MAKVSSLQVGTVQLLNASGNIDWSFFKNTPASLVSSSGHNHDALYYTTATVNSLFKAQEDRIDALVSIIESKAIKYDLLMAGGGATASNAIHNYNLATEVTSQLSGTIPFTSINSPGISSASWGYFTNSSRYVSKLDYFTRVFVTVPSCPIGIAGSMIDYAIQTKGYVSDGAQGWAKLDVKMDTWEVRASCNGATDGRPLLSSQVKGYSKRQGTGFAYEYSYLSSTSRTLSSFTTNGITSGLSRSSNYGFWLSGVGGNFKHTYVTDAITVFTGLAINVNNTNVSTGEFYGLIASGSNSTTVSKLNWATESTSLAVATSVDKTGASSIEQ